VTSNKNWGVHLGLAFVFRGEDAHVLNSSVHFAIMVDNVVFMVQYFWTLQKS
jgi:hypothetical protein